MTVYGGFTELEYGEGARTVRPDDITWDHLGFRVGRAMAELSFPWPELWALRAVEPCPRFEVEYRHIGGRTTHLFVPRFRRERAEVEARVVELFSHVRDHRPHVVSGGWVDIPPVEWERIAAMPGDTGAVEVREGAYRSARVTTGERVLGRWGPPKPYEAMLQWLASTPDRPWRAHPREVVVTNVYVYVRRRDDTLHRIPTETLRAVRDRDVWVFGRGTTLVVPGYRVPDELWRRLTET